MDYRLDIARGQGKLSVSLGYQSSAERTAMDLYKTMLVPVGGEQDGGPVCQVLSYHNA